MRRLNDMNYLNLIGYVLNTTVSCLMIGFGGASSNHGKVSRKYQTLVTPAGWTFSIWGFIFVAQGIFVIVQLLPNFRGLPLVQDGVRYWHFLTCLAQVAWTFVAFFADETQIWLSCYLMSLILITLGLLLICQHQAEPDGTKTEFWIFRFPFAIHFGWIMTLLVVNVNAAFVAGGGTSAGVQELIAVVSYLLFVMVTGYVLFAVQPDYTVALVLAWTMYGITMELRDPPTLLVTTFSQRTMETFLGVSAAICASMILATLCRAIYALKVRKNEIEELLDLSALNESMNPA